MLANVPKKVCAFTKTTFSLSYANRKSATKRILYYVGLSILKLSAWKKQDFKRQAFPFNILFNVCFLFFLFPERNVYRKCETRLLAKMNSKRLRSEKRF